MGCAPSQNKSHESEFSNNVHQQQQQNKQESKNDQNIKNNNNNNNNNNKLMTSQQQEANLANDFTGENEAAFEKEQKASQAEFATSLIRQFSDRNVTTTDVNFHESSNDINDKINLARIASLHTRLTSVRSSDINAIKNTNLTNLTNNSQSSDINNNNNNNNSIDKLSRQLSVTHSSLANGMEFDTYNMENISNHDKYDILCSAITPRPIVFISTIDTKTNIKNLAPMSFAAPVTSDPPSIMISITTLNDKKKNKDSDSSNSKPQRKFKDTLINIQQNGEFVINHLTKDFFDKAYQTSEEYPPEIDEFDQCGLTPLKSDIVAPYRVLESPMQLECKCIKIISINGDNYGGTHIVVGEVVATHVRTDLKIDGEMVNEQAVETVSRLGALRYGTAKVDFEIKKGAWSKDNW